MRRPRPRPLAFYKCFLQGESQLVQMPLRGESRRVLSALRSVMDYENWVRISLREVADMYAMPWGQFRRGLTELRDKGVIIWDEHATEGHRTRVALWVGWRGRDARHGYALQLEAQAEILPLFPDQIEVVG